jgi:hypothetical protein
MHIFVIQMIYTNVITMDATIIGAIFSSTVEFSSDDMIRPVLHPWLRLIQCLRKTNFLNHGQMLEKQCER